MLEIIAIAMSMSIIVTTLVAIAFEVALQVASVARIVFMVLQLYRRRSALSVLSRYMLITYSCDCLSMCSSVMCLIIQHMTLLHIDKQSQL